MARILVVERVPFMRNINRFALEYGGHEIIGEAEDGQQAMDLFDALKPDLVILAIILQKFNGIEVLKRIKSIRPEAKIIVCSSVRQQRMIDLATSYGADSYIIKPFQIINFLHEVNRVLGIEESQIIQKESGGSVPALDVEEIVKKVLTKTISPEELRLFIKTMNQ